jgi:hypothetical protein
MNNLTNTIEALQATQMKKAYRGKLKNINFIYSPEKRIGYEFQFATGKMKMNTTEALSLNPNDIIVFEADKVGDEWVVNTLIQVIKPPMKQQASFKDRQYSRLMEAIG